jgi:ketosteroid isomerase-like protein
MPEEPTTPDLVELVRRVNEAANRREYDVLASLVTPDVVYRPIAAWAESEQCLGDVEFRRFFERFWDAWADDASWHLDTVRVYGDAVIALARFSGHARASGIEVSGGVFGLYRFRDGKVASLEDFTDRDDAVRAAEEPEEAMSKANVENLQDSGDGPALKEDR